MILDPEALKSELIEIYQKYLADKNDNLNKNKAQKLFLEYVYVSDDLDNILKSAIHDLERIGWDYPRSTVKTMIWRLEDDEVKIIIKKLRGEHITV